MQREPACFKGNCTAACLPGYTNCGGLCYDLQTNAKHCGKCNNACSGKCSSGKCS